MHETWYAPSQFSKLIAYGTLVWAVAQSIRSISVASSASAFELLTRFDTGQRCRKPFGAGFRMQTQLRRPATARIAALSRTLASDREFPQLGARLAKPFGAAMHRRARNQRAGSKAELAALTL